MENKEKSKDKETSKDNEKHKQAIEYLNILYTAAAS